MSSKVPEKTILVAKASLFEPNEDDIQNATNVLEKVVSSAERGKAFRMPDRRDDLLYVRKTLVTAGINANDDVFLNDELWKARHTPILKPLNWMHNDKDIIGVMYSSQAYTLDGKRLSDDLETVDQPFELITEGVIYKYTFADRAEEIQRRHVEGSPFISMEAWFDDYDFALFRQNEFDSVIKRENATAFLDGQLKAKGGPGIYDDEGVQKRIARALRNIIFGGGGFVDCPANNRSVVFHIGEIPSDNLEEFAHSVSDFEEASSDSEYLGTGGQTELFSFVDDVPLLANAISTKEDDMADTNDVKSGPVKHLTKGDLRSAIADVLSEHEEAAVQKAEIVALRTLAEDASVDRNKIAKANDQLQGELEIVKSERDGLAKAFDELFEGIVDSTEAQDSLKNVHKAKTAEEAMRMKLALFQEKATSLRDRAAAADKYREQLEEAKVVARTNEISDLFGDLVPEGDLESFQTRAGKMTEEEYQDWISEKRLIIAAFPEDMKKKKKEDKGKETEEGKAAEKFVQDSPLGLQNGTLPGAGGPLANPRFKISGEEELENAEVEGTVNLAGASSGEVEGEADPVAAEASMLAKTFAKQLNPHLVNREKAEGKEV